MPVTRTKAGIRIAVRLTPKSSRDEVGGLETGPDGPRLGARVRAIPDKGAANTALERLIAGWLGVPRSSVGLAAGGKSRYKAVEIAGDPAELERRARDLIARNGN
ncbi:MAG: DUF167 family protein [Hyphomicrobiaceae bacterium]